MARKVRIEYPGAFYHVINRGNYRDYIFDTEGARRAFRKCLVQVCEANRWRLQAWVLMGNHYHLCLQTPEPNLVEGMKWLQSTFANRFNRYRGANGHVFQGRYKAILLDHEAVGPVCHYIHLNPVRARLAGVQELKDYKESSFHQLWNPAKRWPFFDPLSVLEEAGGLPDTPSGRRSYRDYLSWLAEDDATQKRLGFEKMCKGWAKGDKEFRKAVMDDLKNGSSKRVVEHEARELREPHWERRIEQALLALGKTEEDLLVSRKSENWKVALARHMRETCLTPNAWLADRLNMGTPKSLASRVSAHRLKSKEPDDSLRTLKMLECVD